MAQGKRQLLLRYPTSLDVWQLGAAAPSVYQLSANTFLKLSQEPARLLQLKAKDDEWIVCATVSPGGDYVAYATESNVYIYHFIQVFIYLFFLVPYFSAFHELLFLVPFDVKNEKTTFFLYFSFFFSPSRLEHCNSKSWYRRKTSAPATG
jgi:hypothetical protein